MVCISNHLLNEKLPRELTLKDIDKLIIYATNYEAKSIANKSTNIDREYFL